MIITQAKECKIIIYLCLIILYSCTRKEEITFSEHIAPIIYKNCTPCHRNNEAGPFELTNYEQIKKRAQLIQYVTQTHFMPPWPADPNYSHFVGEKTLGSQEILFIKKWVENGCPIGDSTKIPALPSAPIYSLMGKPDLVLRMPRAFFIKGDNTDRFYLMKFPYELPQDTFIKTIEFVPGNKKLVHHVNGFIIQYEEGKKKNIYDGSWFVNTDSADVKTSYEILKLANDDGSYPLLTPSVCNYLPGVEAIKYPNGIGGYKVKKKGAIFLKDMHYGPSRIDQFDSSYFNIYFDKIPPKRRTLELQLGTLGVSKIEPPLIIPPNETKTFTTHTQIPLDMSVLTINPHMHLLGKSYKAFAIKPNGDTIPLISIPKWDFRWQYFYTFQKPVVIPRGSTIWAIGTFDNTKNNPINPFNPPQQIGERNGSMRTTDEMFQFIITYLPYEKGDENIIME